MLFNILYYKVVVAIEIISVLVLLTNLVSASGNKKARSGPFKRLR